MASVVAGSVYGDNGWSLGNFATILSSRFYRGAFETSIGLSLLTSAIGLVIGFPLSLALYRRSSGGF
jgi:putative spermidine/putrescine transport system permease protein